jgi:hypothetical protein
MHVARSLSYRWDFTEMDSRTEHKHYYSHCCLAIMTLYHSPCIFKMTLILYNFGSKNRNLDNGCVYNNTKPS